MAKLRRLLRTGMRRRAVHPAHMLVILLLVAVMPLGAQFRADLLVGAGLSVPSGEFNTYANTGTIFTFGVEHRFGAHPSAIRLDFSYATNKDTTGIGFRETTHLVTGMVNYVYHFTGARPRLYVLAGFGFFARSFSSSDPDDPPIHDSQPAIQLGEGVNFRIRSLSLFIEGRFVESVGLQRFEYFPVTVGVRF